MQNDVFMRRAEMLIQATSISIKYKRIDNLKKNYFLNEDILKPHFSEASVLPIPDEAPFDLSGKLDCIMNEMSVVMDGKLKRLLEKGAYSYGKSC